MDLGGILEIFPLGINWYNVWKKGNIFERFLVIKVESYNGKCIYSYLYLYTHWYYQKF